VEKKNNGGKKCILKKARRIVAFFSRSTQATAKLHEIQKTNNTNDPTLDLKADVVTRWWSTQTMLDRLSVLREALALYALKQKFPANQQAPFEWLDDEEWDALEILKKLLEPLKFAQNLLEGQKYVTSFLVPYIVTIINIEMESVSTFFKANSSIREIAEAMQSKMSDIFGTPETMFSATIVRGHGKRQRGLNKAILFAHALDPRFKTLGILDDDNKEELWVALKQEMIRLKPERLQIPSDVHEQTSPVAAARPPGLMQKYANLYAQSTASTRSATSWQSKCDVELSKYLEVASVPICEKFDPLEWWKAHSTEFPTLWLLATVYFAIPATSAPSERAFSVAGNIVTMRRCRLNDRNLEDLHHLHENF
jgi:hypothetical protein